jgi:RNA polymerase sigma-70 factor (ECF subfamily)
MPPSLGAIAPVFDVEAPEAEEGQVKTDPGLAALARERMLVTRLRRGDPRAFAELVRAYQDRVFNLTYRMLGNKQEAEDLAQEIFVSLHGALEGFRGDSRLSTWIFRVTRNHCLNRLKYLSRRDRGRASEISQVPESSFTPPDEKSVDPHEAIEAKERSAQIRRAIDALDDDHRLLVVLRDIEGLSYDEIAQVTEQPEGTVKSRLHRARVALAVALGKIEGAK